MILFHGWKKSNLTFSVKSIWSSLPTKKFGSHSLCSVPSGLRRPHSPAVFIVSNKKKLNYLNQQKETHGSMWKKTPLAVSRGLRSEWILIFSIWIYFSSGSLLSEEYKKKLHLKPSIPHRSIDGSISGRSVCFTSKRKTADKGNCWRFLGGRFGEGRGRSNFKDEGAVLRHSFLRCDFDDFPQWALQTSQMKKNID